MVHGLTLDEVHEKQKQLGLNILEEKKKKTFIAKLFEQFNNFLTVLLLIAALLSFVIGETVDGGLIISIVVLNALFGLYQEAKAEEAIAALKDMTVTKVRVMRDGKEQEVDSKELVPGDIIFIEEGVKIAADAQIVEHRNLEINEAALTGESLPVVKSNKEEIFMGTIVAKGRATCEVMRTGMHTKFGQIAANLSAIDESKTPLQKKLEDLTRVIGIIGIVASVIVFGLSLIQGDTYFPAFLLAISLAVAVVPEGLPAVMTVTLSIGVKEMAKRKAVIRKLSAIEALGSITIIATDKTGTLTANKMTVKELFFDGKLHADPEKIDTHGSTVQLLLEDSILCSTASLVYKHDHGTYEMLGDPTEGALLLLAQKKGFDPETVRKEWKILDEQPFSSITKQMMVEVKKGGIHNALFKGAPETIIDQCTHKLSASKESRFTDADKQLVKKQLEAWAKKGLRVLAFSFIRKPETKQIFLGLAALHDPPRPEVNEALNKTRMAGINVVMITGDNEKTAEAIGLSIGLIKENELILTGKQVDEYSDEALEELLPKVRIFARTTPLHKHRIVQLYQKRGEVVAVTGDGVNDAIALKQADVGVAMGLVGTDVARETADMVITDDNFATIVNAIEEGRNTLRNLKNAIKYLLACNLGEATVLIVGLLVGIDHILLPIQLLYVNLVTDGLPALSLAFSPRNPAAMKNVPDRQMTLLRPFDMRYIFMVGIFTASLVLGAFVTFNADKSSLAKTAAFSVLALTQSFILVDLWLSHRSLLRHLHLLKSPLFLMAFLFPFVTQLIIVSTPTLAQLFKIEAINTVRFMELVFISSLVLVGIHNVKRFLNHIQI